MPLTAFVPLHVKSQRSFGLGTAAIPALVQHAGRAGFTHLGLSDLENVSGQVQFHAACRAAGLRPITGVELRPQFRAGRTLGQRRGRLVFLAADARGYATLCRIVTRRRHSPNVSAPLLEALDDYSGGAFLLTDDALLLAELVRLHGPAAVRALVVRPRPSTPEAELLLAARRLGVATLASLDTTVLDASEAALQQLACAVHLECGRNDAALALVEDGGRPFLPQLAVDALFADLHSLDEIDECLAALRRREPSPAWALGPSAIPLADAATFATIDRAETLGCFQLESPAMRAVLARLPIRDLGDVTHALAIVRPGPASGHAKQLFLARARGEASSPELNALLRPRLQATHGLLLYEEDILFVLSQLTGLPLETAEALRVTLSERADDALWRERAHRRFLARTGARGVAPLVAEAAWADVLRFVRYSFNQAHTTSQALLAYQLAFLKTHAPLELGCALLNHHGGLYPRRVIGAELRRRGVSLLSPCLERSELACSISSETPAGALRIGLGLLKGLRAATQQRILAARERRGPASASELLHGLRLQPRELRALVWSGACDALLGLRPSDYPWMHEALLAALERGARGSLDEVLAAARQQLPREPQALVERYRALSRVQHELEYLELHVSDHPLRILRGEAALQGCIPSDQLREHVGERVKFAGVVAAARRIPLANAAVTQFLSLEDEHGLVEARLSPAAYERLHAVLTTPGPFLVTACVREQQGACYLDIEELLPFHQRAQHGP